MHHVQQDTPADPQRNSLAHTSTSIHILNFVTISDGIGCNSSCLLVLACRPPVLIEQRFTKWVQDTPAGLQDKWGLQVRSCQGSSIMELMAMVLTLIEALLFSRLTSGSCNIDLNQNWRCE